MNGLLLERLCMDSMTAFVNDDQCFVGLDGLRTMIHQIKFAMAFAEMRWQSGLLIQGELFECDGARVGVSRKSGKVWHLKRRKRFPISKTPGAKAQAKARSWPKAKPKAKAKAKPKAKPKDVVSHGRLLVLKGRFTKKRIVKPLNSKSHSKAAHGAPETKREVLKQMAMHVDHDSLPAATVAKGC